MFGREMEYGSRTVLDPRTVGVASTPLRITTASGRVLDLRWLQIEPGCGSIALTHGTTGTAWQRQHRDGLWHRAGGGRSLTWLDLIKRNNVLLVHYCPDIAVSDSADNDYQED